MNCQKMMMMMMMMMGRGDDEIKKKMEKRKHVVTTLNESRWAEGGGGGEGSGWHNRSWWKKGGLNEWPRLVVLSSNHPHDWVHKWKSVRSSWVWHSEQKRPKLPFIPVFRIHFFSFSLICLICPSVSSSAWFELRFESSKYIHSIRLRLEYSLQQHNFTFWICVTSSSSSSSSLQSWFDERRLSSWTWNELRTRWINSSGNEFKIKSNPDTKEIWDPNSQENRIFVQWTSRTRMNTWGKWHQMLFFYLHPAAPGIVVSVLFSAQKIRL